MNTQKQYQQSQHQRREKQDQQRVAGDEKVGGMRGKAGSGQQQWNQQQMDYQQQQATGKGQHQSRINEYDQQPRQQMRSVDEKQRGFAEAGRSVHQPPEIELPNQLEELASRYLNSQYRSYYNQHKNNPKVLALPPQQQQDLIQQKFDSLFDLDFSAIQKTRVEGKFQMQKGEFYQALEENLLRAYISLERLDVSHMCKPHQQEKVKLLISEQLVKILKLLYVAVSLCPEHLQDQLALSLSTSSSPASQDQDLHAKSPKPPKLDHELLLLHLAQELYNEDIFSGDHATNPTGIPTKSRKSSRMDFETYRAKVLELLVVSYKYDNSKAQSGLCDPRSIPNTQEQREYMEPLLLEMEIDFMPKRNYQVYHVVCVEWYNHWRKWVGLPVKGASQSQDQSQTTDAQDAVDHQQEQDAPQMSAHEKFKNLNKKQRKQAKQQQKSHTRGSERDQNQQYKQQQKQDEPVVTRIDESGQSTQINKSNNQETINRPPGPINYQSQLSNICLSRNQVADLLPFNDDPLDNKLLRPPTEIQENENYVILDDQCFQYLFGIYGGIDVRRHSIQIEDLADDENQEDDDTNTLRSSTRDQTFRNDEQSIMNDSNKQMQKSENKPNIQKQYVVELHLRRLRVHLVPQMNFFPTYNKMPFTVFISRGASVGELHMKVAQALLSRTNLGHSVLQLLSWSRLWKVDSSKETVAEISDQIYATNGNPEQLPIEVFGSLLDQGATIDSINVADNEILMLEVKISTDQRDQTPYACTPAGKGTGLDNKGGGKNKKFQQMNRNQKQLEEEENRRMNMQLIDVMKQHHNGGITGLQNLGNTCFMSSVLQCLANTEPLTKYFLFEVHVFHLNSKNSLGTRGKLALAFGELVGELWVGQNRYVAPWDVKRIIAMKASQFQGFAQHDSQEMLSVLLETLHEDVNGITKKPYVEYKDSDNRSDEEVAKEYWDGFKKRESSIFVDLFYGQLKSRVQCTQCDRVSITFDPFNVLSLPIPSQKNQCFTIKYLPCSMIEYPTEFQISVGEYVTVNEIRQKIESYLRKEKEIEGQPEEEWLEPFLTQVINKQQIDIIVQERFLRTHGLEKGVEIVAYEREPFSYFDLQADDDESSFHICEIRMVQSRKSYMVFNSLQSIGYSKLHLFKKSWTAYRIKLRIYEIVRPLIHKIPLPKDKTYDQCLEQEFQRYFMLDDGSYNLDNPYYDIEIHNNLPLDQSSMFSRQVRCDFCQQEHKDNCMFAFPDDTTLEDILSLMRYERELELTINWKSNAKALLKLVESPVFRKINLNAPSLGPQTQQRGGLPKFSLNQRNVNIYDCLSCFGQEETLAGNDKWYCSKCKEHVPALKKIEIYNVPEFLIVHFKRFSHQRNSMFGSRKLNMHIDFPVVGLDMTSYLVSNMPESSSTAIHIDDCDLPSPEATNQESDVMLGKVFPGKSPPQQKKFIYDLYAVSNHYGSLNGGHYTAFCQNPMVKKWYEFDDTHVSKVSQRNDLDEIERAVVGKAAYVLFYRLRKQQSNKK